MPDSFDANGLTVKTLAEITADLKAGFQGIYGADINLDQNSPDGQAIGIFAQAGVDLRELAAQINNGFDPDQAQGVILDQRVVINNIAREGGTFTIQPVDITVSQTVTLQGLDANFNSVTGTGYTVQDGSGNQFILIDSATITTGTHSLEFRAQQIGLVNTVVNTIVNPVTVVIGVTAVNNSSAALSIGQNQESDPQLRARRQKSVSLNSSANLDGVRADLLALSGVTGAETYMNVTDDVDANGIPGHCLWAIVEGGANSDIGETIYSKISYGCNMKGTVEVDIITASGSLFVVLFDRPTPENLYIRFNIKRTTPLFVFDMAAVQAYVVANTAYQIGEFAETSRITAAAVAGINAGGGGGVPLDTQISLDGFAWTDYLDVATLASKWTLDVSRVTITVV